MTKEEAREMLTNTKVYVNGKSKEIQEKLFEIGFRWGGIPEKIIRSENDPFIYIQYVITRNSDMLFFGCSKLKEVSADDILNIKLDEELFPKNGDILFIKEKYSNEPWISIFKKLEDKSIYTYINLDIKTGFLIDLDFSEDYLCYVNDIDVLRLATKEEKEILFSALKENGYVWNEKTKEVETIKQPNKWHEFKPFDKVMVRDFGEDNWDIDFFQEIGGEDIGYQFICLAAKWNFCIPYEGNEELLGTSNSPKE